MRPFSVKSRFPHQGIGESAVDLHPACVPTVVDHSGLRNPLSVLLTKGSTADKGVIGA